QLKPPAKSLWGYGGIVQAPDGTIWQIVTSNKKNTGPATRTIDNVVLLLGVQDVKASKQFYTEQGLKAAKSFGGKYAEFAPQDTDAVSLALYKRRGLAKLAGVSEEGTGSHRITLHGHAGDFTDPDAFRCDSAVPTARPRTPGTVRRRGAARGADWTGPCPPAGPPHPASGVTPSAGGPVSPRRRWPTRRRPGRGGPACRG